MILRWTIIGLMTLSVAVGLVAGTSPALAGEADQPWVSKVTSVQGQVVVQRLGESLWQPVKLNDTLFAGDRVRVAANSRAGVVLSNDATLRLDQNTTLVFSEIEKETTFIIRLLEGVVNFFSRRPRSLKVVTPFVNGVVEGTEFLVQVDEDQTRIDLFEGRIRAENQYGELLLAKGEGAVAKSGSAPQRYLLVQPRDSVQWALYYPPTLALSSHESSGKLEPSLQRFNQGRTLEAIEELEPVATPDRDAAFFSFRSALLLHQGRVDQARDDLRQALALDPDHGEALALEAVIHVVQNRKSEALETARRAVKANPRSVAAHMALSYAQQAEFDLAGALASAQAAVSAAPDSGTAWARLAELQLSTGQLDKGVKSARKAVERQPNVSHAHTILGFAYLTRIKTGKSRESFEKAIALDSAAPLPRLGMGLARIRDGDLDQGRIELEIAVSLDPVNAMLRSYLGKAYFDEKRGPLDEKQLEIAKNLDPNDPTPWFYDAIRKQSLNRPGEALKDLQKSIELNDNRAVYRSRLLLDEDLAARSAALGRIYNNLSFQEQALRQGAKSLRTDPTNFSAHRLLSDIYANRPRHQISQVSELLQSQLLQPLNLTPVPPQSVESTQVVAEGTGPLSASFNEFNPLFTRDQLTVQVSGAAGNNDTWSTETSAAAIYKGLSLSLGKFHYQTEGFRPNNNLDKDIISGFAQVALSPKIGVQLEYRQEEVIHGDLELNFDPLDLKVVKQITREDKTRRIGLQYVPVKNHHIITSLIFNQTDFSRYTEDIPGSTGFGRIVVKADRLDKDDAFNLEGQYIFRGRRFNAIIGGGYYEQDLLETNTTSVTSGPLILSPERTTQDKTESWHSNAYTYLYLKPLNQFDILFGLSSDSYNKGEIKAIQLNPKFGFNWYLSPSLSVRGAAFRSLKRSLVSNQTIEPAQVAGFAQFFDDPTAADAMRYGFGVDYQITGNLSCGAELTRHDLSHPRGSPIRKEKHRENHHLVYLYWLPLEQFSVSAEYRYDYYKRDPLPVDVARPFILRTHTVPLTLAYFHSTGISANIRGTYRSQRVEQYATSSLPPEIKRDNFTLVDVGISYRLPRRYGILSFSINNLFDTDFNFQDTNFLTSNEQTPEITPERQYLLKATIKF